MKQNWKPIAVVLALALVGSASFCYIHNIYLPAKQAENARQVQESAQVDAVATPATSYDYTIKVTPTPPPTEASKSLDENDATGAVANIASAGENIVGEDGIYHGEQPENTSAQPEQLPQAESQKQTQTATPAATQKPAEKKQTKSTSQTQNAAAPVATPQPVQQTTSNSGSSTTPKDGDRRTVDGQLQEYVSWWGWVPVGSGSYSEPSKGTSNGELGDICPNASFG